MGNYFLCGKFFPSKKKICNIHNHFLARFGTNHLTISSLTNIHFNNVREKCLRHMLRFVSLWFFEWQVFGFLATASTTTSTTTATTVTVPSQCSSGYVSINDMTRLTIAAGGTMCDSSPPFFSVMNWFRFSGLGGTMITTSSPGPNQCGTLYTGWYPGLMPTQGATVVGTVCFGSVAISCQYIQTIVVTNCTSFYLYGLVIPPVCNARYCTV